MLLLKQCVCDAGPTLYQHCFTVLCFLGILCHQCTSTIILFIAGDVAILLNSGFKPAAALILNLLSALAGFVGLYVGLSLASDESARQWIFTLAAGMFLYIALADMVGTLHCINALYEA